VSKSDGSEFASQLELPSVINWIDPADGKISKKESKIEVLNQPKLSGFNAIWLQE
jgi:hypothetical protein